MSPVVDLRDLARTYPGPPPVHALRPCSLSIDRGEHVAVVGPSGSGKSTLMQLVGMLDRPTQGTYLLDGIDTAALNEAHRTGLRTRIGFVFQRFHLIDQCSALDNVALGLLYHRTARRLRRSQAAEMLRRVDLGHRAHAPAGQLSGGERQRVAIARALIAAPSLLLCDEPTGNLDSRSAAGVLDLIDQVHRDGQTVVVVTHDATVANSAPRRISIRDGIVTDSAASVSR